MSSKSLWNEVTCFLCVKCFIDPVTLGCGHSFCMPCLCLYWEEGQRPPPCPVGRETPHQLNLKTNTNLRKLVLLARQDPVTYRILQKRYVRYTGIPRTSSVKSPRMCGVYSAVCLSSRALPGMVPFSGRLRNTG